MKDADRQRIKRCLEEIDTWRASGIKLKAYVQSRGEELAPRRARLSWERRWRQALDGSPGVAFVLAVPARLAKATKPPKVHPTPMGNEQITGACVRIVVSREGSAVRAPASSGP